MRLIDIHILQTVATFRFQNSRSDIHIAFLMRNKRLYSTYQAPVFVQILEDHSSLDVVCVTEMVSDVS